MAILTDKLLTSQAAKRYADQWLIIRDLVEIQLACEALLALKDPWRTIEGRALIDFVFMRYRRCFNSGARATLRGLVGKLSEEERKTHNYVMDLADSHVAHSESNFEVGNPYIRIAAEETPVRRVQIGVQRLFTVPLDRVRITSISALVATLNRGLVEMNSKAYAKVQEEVADMSDAELLTLEPVAILDLVAASGSRRQWPPSKN